ncbi:hypothetical protein [Streptomyces sp. Ag109_G2-15]|uniref:hypothetical protein n=1 Tax=Streptomyces sp. Ag109_G2-15 TaxID=1938850 RepID=UPI000BD2CC4C|nr:hypothetical protein [Streptomyces sp. Ag109_G2-15]SOD86564.1 hypothetical protein SAMN06272765_4025 [Streptomyces sp. Ag109_G2-15]
MTAEHEGAGEYAGMDALMAAITGEPLPEEAHRDAAYLSEHRSAEADVALLKDQLTWLAEALTGEEQGEEQAAAPAAAEAGSTAGPARSAPSGKRPRSTTRPTAPVRPTRPGRPSGPRRALRLALGSLAFAAAFSMVAGLGWLVTHTGADDSMGGSSADAKTDARSPEYSSDSGRPSDPEQALACSKLVVEGTVAAVDPQPQTPWTRIVLTVTRSYKPARGPAEVAFLLDDDAKPAPHKGQHVLVGVDQGRKTASRWSVGDTRVAADRAWITEALPDSRHTTCPSEDQEPTGKP